MAWGLYFALFLILEKFLFRWEPEARGWQRPLRRLYTLAVVFFGWFLFRFEDLSLTGKALAALFGFGNGFVDLTARTTLSGNLFLLLACALACTPVVPFLSGKLRELRSRGQSTATRVAGLVTDCVCALSPALLLLLSTLALVGNTYNPFLYFRF